MRAKSMVWNSTFMLGVLQCALAKLNPLRMIVNPVMLLVECGAVITLVIAILGFRARQAYGFDLQISLWLWFTVLFANFAEALAEGKAKVQANALKQMKSESYVQRVLENGELESIQALLLRKGDIVLVTENMIIPSDGDVVDGVALVDESAITGESAPVVREFGGDKTSVTCGTRILSGKIKIEITVNPGETFVDQMINMIESAKRKKTSNELALGILLFGLTLLSVIVVLTLPVFANYMHINISITALIALLVCFIPTTIGGLLPAIGSAGMDRLLAHNVVALNSRAIEAAGDVNVVLLDKTGTITLGNRIASKFIPAPGVKAKELAKFAMLASLADETPEGRSIVVLAKEILRMRGRDIQYPIGARFVEFSAETRMSGIDVDLVRIRKGAPDAIENFAKSCGVDFPQSVMQVVGQVAGEGSTPLVVADRTTVYGVICLKDVLKQDIRERLLQLKNIGITSVMITGDNPITAATIAAEAGVSDFIAQATPTAKLELIKKYQADGYIVAMIGDGTNDAPALAQADVAVAMNAGTQAAREAANMIDLDSSPTKLLDIIEIGKQILITRGALTTFSIMNDVAKYFAIIPALFIVHEPWLRAMNVMNLATAHSAILAAVIFNALIIPFLIPLALRGVKYKQTVAKLLLRKNLLIYGVGGLLLPFMCIKGIDMALVGLRFI